MNIASFTGAYMFGFVVIVITFSLFLFIPANCVFFFYFSSLVPESLLSWTLFLWKLSRKITCVQHGF